MSVNCPHCSAALATDARFCPSCGQVIVSTETDPSGSNRMSAPDMIGKDIAGRFRLLAKIGEGGMGAVYRGEQTSLKRACAIKLLRPELSANQQLLARFETEAKNVARLNHPNTVQIYDYGRDSDGSLFIAMEFIEGQPLRAVIGNAGPLPLARAFNIALQVAASLADAHANGIIHRDLKPDNVMLQQKGKHRDVARVLDFGIAKLRDDSRQTHAAMTQAGDMLGTPQYMAPEQIRGDTIDGRTDVYALGCMIYEMVTARLPFEATTIMAMLSKHLTENPVPPSQRRPDLKLPPAVDHVVMVAMAKDPAQRPATMEQYAEMLAGVLAQLPPDPAYQASAAMSAMSPAVAPPFTTPATARHTPPTHPPPIHAPTPAPAYMANTPAPPQPYQPGYAAPPYQPPAIPPTVGVQHARPSRSKLPLFLLLGALALGGAGVGVWAATRSSDKPKEDDHQLHVDQPSTDDHDQPDKPDKPDQPDHDDHDVDVPVAPPSNGTDPWANNNQGAPATPPQPHHTPAPPPSSVGGHNYSCEQVAAHALQVFAEELRKQLTSMTPQQMQQMQAQLQQLQQQAQTLYQQIVDQCKREDWKDSARKCAMDSTSFADISKCQ